MAEIDDITKLRPELANISLAELERRETELQMARAHIEKREAEKQREEYARKLSEARKSSEEEYDRQLESAVDAIQKLNRFGGLKQELLDAATDSRGVFVAANLFRRKLPADWVPPGFDTTGAPAPAKRSASGRKQARVDILSSKGQKPVEAITELLSKATKPLSRDEILAEMKKDTGFALHVVSSPKSFTGALSSLIRMKIIEKEGENYKIATTKV